MNHAGGFYADLIGLADESAVTAAREFKPAPAETASLLTRQFVNGHRLEPRPTLIDSREHWQRSLGQLEQRYQDLESPAVYPVRYTAALNAMLTNEKLRAERRQA